MGYVNVIWQGDAVADSIRALALAAAPAAPLNVTGPGVLAVRELAERFGRELGRPPQLVGQEGGTALLSNASLCHGRFGPPRVSLEQLISWTAAWLVHRGPTWGKPTGFERRTGQY
jgi:nucleoside-diphosphate-sugar epimerase